MSLFQTSNGYVNLAASSDRLWQRLCDVLDDSSLASDPRYATDPLRSKNRVALNERIASLIITRATREWCDIFDAAGIPAGPLYEIDEMFADPQVEHLNMTTEVEHSVRGKVALIRQPVGMSRTPAKITRASPMPGQDRDEILQELGYTSTQIVELAELGVV
jgi:formyl-CoA transferase